MLEQKWKLGDYMTTFLDIVNSRREFDKFGMKIHLKLPRTDLVDFRIAYSNLYFHANREGIGVATDEISCYSQEMVHQLENAGYYVSEIAMIWTEYCYDIFLRESDKNKEYPKMKVYVHPNEMSGWAPKKEIDKFLEIAKNNSYINNVQLVYSRKVYIMDDEKYLSILKEAEPEIVEWLKKYKKYYKRRIYDATTVFNDIFGINRLQVKRLSYKDYVAKNYISSLICSNGL